MSQYILVLLASVVFVGLMVGATLEVKENARRKRKRVSPQVFRGWHG